MENPAETKHPVSSLLKRRWSPRAIDPARPVEREKLLSLLEAARWDPSAYNEQPWRYLVFEASDGKNMEKARSCLVEGNAWAKAAPVLLISVTKEDFTQTKEPNGWALHDLGLANENLFLQAVELGLAAHPMAGFDPQKARELFRIPEGFSPVAMIAIGYPGDPKALNPKLQEMEKAPRTRKEILEFAFREVWGKPV